MGHIRHLREGHPTPPRTLQGDSQGSGCCTSPQVSLGDCGWDLSLPVCDGGASSGCVTGSGSAWGHGDGTGTALGLREPAPTCHPHGSPGEKREMFLLAVTQLIKH